LVLCLATENQLIIYTIGHSTRTLEEFAELLKAYIITFVLDVRTVPRSRHNSQFNKETLPTSLKELDIRYRHMPEIGGLRHPKPDSINLAWKNSSFRGYADYMQSKEFTEALLRLIALARENCLAVMCAEALPWRCHRSLISDALVTRHIKVLHIISKTDTIDHKLNEIALVDGNTITYPLYSKDKAQMKLGDFWSE
jgi:uncharacterized protein (DUF488 family)